MTNTEVALWAQNQEPSALLELFIDSFNKSNEQYNALLDDLKRTESKLEAEKRFTQSQAEQIAKQQEKIKELEAYQDKSESALTEALKNAQHLTATKRELTVAKNQLAALQKQWNEANPKKLKEQIKRVKEQNEKLSARNKKLDIEAKEYRKEIAHHKEKTTIATNKVIELKQQLAMNTGAGLFHKGTDHLLYWPQQTIMERPDKSRFKSTSLLYMDQCGRGGLVSLDPETGKAQLCAAPKGGLRISKETVEFAQNWLHKVNELQDGEVYEEDMIPVNHNVDLELAS